MCRVTSVARSLFALVVAALIANCADGPTSPTRNDSAVPPISLATASNGAGLSITTDKDDYAPGDTVWFTGAGWTPGDSLDIVLTDSTDTHRWAVGIDENGGFRDSTYVVDTGDLGVTFTLTATSRLNAMQTLSVMFTDAGNITVKSNKPGVTFTVTATKYVGSASCASGAQTPTTSLVTNSSSNNFSLNSTSDSYKFEAQTPSSDQGAGFQNWTTADPVVSNVGSTICVAGFNGSRSYTANYDANPDLTVSKSATTATFAKNGNGFYTISVINSGTATTTAAFQVIDTLPTGLTFVSKTSGAAWSCSSVIGGNGKTIVTCSNTGSGGNAIAPTDDSDVTFQVAVGDGACGGVTNYARVSGGGETNTANDNSNELTTSVTGCNQAPTANAGADKIGNEGALIEFDGSGSSDPDAGDVIHFLWTVDYATNSAPYMPIDGGGSCSFVDPDDNTNTRPDTLAKPHIRCTDDSDGGKFKVTLTVTDSHGASDEDTADLTVNNVAPDVSMTTPADYSVYAITDGQLGSLGFAGASFTDPGANDTHTGGSASSTANVCKIDWGEGTVSVGTVSEPSGSTPGSCSSPALANPYLDNGAGIYTITVTVIDDDAGSDSDSRTIVVYDPSAGFVTGGGWIGSPAGAYKADGGLTGKANFGFVSKYLKNATMPTGNTEFQFQAGNLNFHSESYEWLVVNQGGTNGQYKGAGTINGQGCASDREGKCRFMLWASDGAKTGDPDTFRIEIWWEDSGLVKHDIYDNGSAQPIAGGSIQVQTGKK